MLSHTLHPARRRAVRYISHSWRVSLAAVASLPVLLWSAVGQAQNSSEPVPLPALGADLDATSVSGLSSGAFMASQFHLAHSHIVIGAGIVAGGPFGCAEAATPWFAGWYGLPAVVYWAQGRCMQESLFGLGIPSTSTLDAKIRALAKAKRIDSLSEIARAHVYLYTSSADDVVRSPVVDAVEALYGSLGVPKPNIKMKHDTKAQHAFLTKDKGAVCGDKDDTFITHCDSYDQAGAILRHMYPDVSKRGAPPPAEAFNQEPFTRGSIAHGLADTGYVYVASQCRGTPGCRVHVVFHGCSQNGNGFVRDAGYAEWIDDNRLIILFPQVEQRPIVNPLGCWDWVGYTGADYLTHDGPQIAAVKRMLDQLAKPAGAN